jgi:hypothetical protein
MKKVLALLAIVLGCAATSVMAQGPGGGQQDPAQRIAMWKERLKPIGLSDVQTDSAIAIIMDRSMMQGMNFREMSDADRQAAMKTMSEARAKRMEKAGISKEQIAKIMELASQRPGGGGGGGGRQK